METTSFKNEDREKPLYYQKKNNITPRIRLHDLRHSHASFLLNNGANILAVSKRLGHATVTQTLETYAHLMQDTEEQMMEIIENKSKTRPNDKKTA